MRQPCKECGSPGVHRRGCSRKGCSRWPLTTAQQAVVAANVGLAFAIAARFRDYDAALSDAFLAMCRSARTWNPRQSFAKYVYPAMMREIMGRVRRENRLFDLPEKNRVTPDNALGTFGGRNKDTVRRRRKAICALVRRNCLGVETPDVDGQRDVAMVYEG